MTNLLLTRVDNRLVHGQVGVTWTSTIGANLLVVIDDIVSNDPIQQQLMAATVNSLGVGIRFFSIEKALSTIEKASPQQKLFLVCRTPDTVKKLVEGGVPIDKVNLGNMHFSEGKVAISKKVYVDEKDKADINSLIEHDIYVFIQDVPSEKKIELKKVL